MKKLLEIIPKELFFIDITEGIKINQSRNFNVILHYQITVRFELCLQVPQKEANQIS